MNIAGKLSCVYMYMYTNCHPEDGNFYYRGSCVNGWIAHHV